MSLIEHIIRISLLFGILFAAVGTLFVIYGICTKVKVTIPTIVTIIGILLMVPFILCDLHGEEHVEVMDIPIYSMDGEYLYQMDKNTYEVCLRYTDNYYAREFVVLNSINRIEDNSEPHLQRVTTFLRYGPLEISDSIFNAFVPVID